MALLEYEPSEEDLKARHVLKAMSVVIAVAPSSVFGQSEEELHVVRQVLEMALPKSFAENREYCGYIGFDDEGALKSSRIKRGRTDECRPPSARQLDVIASWHTHAGFDHEALSEVPSVTDIEADEDEGIDGYLATPGGRFWYIDTEEMEVSQICGLGCLPSDPNFEPGAEGPIAASYTYEELLRREAEMDAAHN